MEHTFTANIKGISQQHFGKDSEDIFNNSQLIQYLNFKTRSANKGSKARAGFANLAINIPTLNQRFADSIKLGYLKSILGEIITQSKVEFNYTDTDEIYEPDD